MLCGAEDEWCECADGADALEAAQRFHPDWVFMDIEMPRQDGITTARQLKRDFPEVRVVIISQHDDPELRASASEAGADHYFRKEELYLLRNLVKSD